MESLDLQVLGDALAWHRAGHLVTLVTVVQTWGSAPRPPGALLAVRGDGMVSGSVPGGCVEDDLIARVKSGERSQRPGMIAYGVSQDEAARFKDAVHDGMGDSIAAGTPRPRRLPG